MEVREPSALLILKKLQNVIIPEDTKGRRGISLDRLGLVGGAQLQGSPWHRKG